MEAYAIIFGFLRRLRFMVPGLKGILLVADADKETLDADCSGFEEGSTAAWQARARTSAHLLEIYYNRHS